MKFNKAGIDNYREIKKYLEKSENRDCNFSAGNIITWGAGRDISYTILSGVIVFRTITEKTATYSLAEYTDSFPLIIMRLSCDAKALGKEMFLGSLTEPMRKSLKEHFPDDFVLGYDRDGSDYVYEVEALAQLRGKKYHKKKNHVNRFMRAHEFTYEEITSANKGECMAMAEKWCQDKEMNLSLKQEKSALEEAFANYEELEFLGGLIRVNGKVMAFTMGEKVTEDTFVTHFEKALEEIPELYAVINQQFAQHALQAFTYVNREEDLGVEGLRRAKESYHPVFMVEKYSAVPAENSRSAACFLCGDGYSKTA